jgi:hypothetical protein
MRLHGFTLLEAMISVAILTVAAPAVLIPFATGMQSDAEDARQALATTLATEMMDEALSKPFSDPEGPSVPGPEFGETTRFQFDNIDDYHNYTEASGLIADAFGDVMTEPGASGLSRAVDVEYVYVSGQDTAESPSFVRITVTVLDGDRPVATLARLRYDHSTVGSGSIATGIGGDGDLLLLGTSGTTLRISGNGEAILEGNVQINSSHSQALAINGNAKLEALALGIVGGYSESGNADIDAPITLGVTPLPDPFAAVPEPTSSDYTTRSTSKLNVTGNDTAVLQPGVYSGGIDLSGNAVVTMEPGVYYLDDGGFSISGNADVQADGVMIYIASSGEVRINGNGEIDWTPPDSGTYEGFCVFYERGLSEEFHLSGNGDMQVTGAIYGTGAEANLSGNGSADTLGGCYIVDTMEITGNGDLILGHDDARHFDSE